MHLRTPFYDRCPESQYRLQHFVCIQLFLPFPPCAEKQAGYPHPVFYIRQETKRAPVFHTHQRPKKTASICFIVLSH